MHKNYIGIRERIKGFLFNNSSARQTVAKNTFWLAVSNLGGRFLRAIIVIYAARILGAAEWGAFSYAFTLVAFFTIFTDLGIEGVTTREVSKLAPGEERDRFIGTAFGLKTALTIIGMLFVVIGTPYLSNIPLVQQILPIIAVVLIFDNLRNFWIAYARGREKMEWEAGLFIFTNLAIVIAGFIFLYISPTVRSFTYSYLFGAGLGMVLALWIFRKELLKTISGIKLSLAYPIISAAWPFAVASILGGLMINTDTIIIGWLYPPEVVGYYGAAQRIILILYIIPSVIASGTFPLFARLVRVNDDRARTVLERSLVLVYALGLPLTAGGVLLAKSIIVLLYGAEYEPATVSFLILMLTVSVNFISALLSNTIFAFQNRKILVIYSAVGACLNILLDLVLISLWGIAGSALATLIVQTVGTVYLWKKTQALLTFSVLPYLRNIALATGIMGISIILFSALGAATLLNILLSGLIYIGVLFYLQEPLIREVKTGLFQDPRSA